MALSHNLTIIPVINKIDLPAADPDRVKGEIEETLLIDSSECLLASAKLGQPEVNLGIMPGAGGTQRLINLVGLGKAKELILTGDIIDAHEAERIGLVNKVVPSDQVMEAAREMARKIIGKGPLAVRLAKMTMNAGVQGGQAAAMLVERFAQTALMTTEDKNEGTSAFLEKRKAEFKGR